MRLVVTTVLEADEEERAAAANAARLHGLELVERRERSLASLARQLVADALLVLGRRRASLWYDGREVAWNGGMGMLRARRIRRGERITHDAFLEAAALRPGDEVVDATLGLGMDALVASAAVGAGGRVVGIESSPALAALTAEGLVRCADQDARRIEVVHGDAAEVLQRLPSRSVDVVVFDPMFRHPRASSAEFDVVRRFADPRALSPDALACARRVARRWVIVKDGAPGWDLARLGLTPLPSARGAKRFYARVAPTG